MGLEGHFCPGKCPSKRSGGNEWGQIFILDFATSVSSIKKSAHSNAECGLPNAESKANSSRAHSVKNIIHKANLVGIRSEDLGTEHLTQIFGLKKTKLYDNIL